MKKLSLMLIYLLICLLLTGCSIVPELKDFDIIHNKEYYSVFLQQDEEKTYFYKGY